jgi:hypothetical protein
LTIGKRNWKLISKNSRLALANGKKMSNWQLKGMNSRSALANG